MLFTTGFILSLAVSINAIPVPKAQTPDFNTLDACPTNGAIVCSPDGTKFYLCNFGRAVPMGSVAAGMKCMNGQMVTMGASAPPTMKPEPTMPTYMPEPTTAELVMTTSEAAKPTQAPMDPMPEPPKEEVTTTITTTTDVKIKSTSTVLVTVTGEAPEMPMPTETSASQPVPTSDPAMGGPIVITEDVILNIAPDAEGCPRDSVLGKIAPEECATAKHAAPFITEAFAEYKINSIGEAASILSLMLFETANFTFNINHFSAPPFENGQPGQGTRNMMSPMFVTQYAQTFGSTDSIKPGLTPENIMNETPEIKNAVRALVLGDDKTWASGAWFYATHPPCAQVMPGLQKSPVSMAAWELYITACVGTTVTDERSMSFISAVKALGGSTTA